MNLDQSDRRAYFESLGDSAWTVIADSHFEANVENYGIYCALSAPTRRAEALGRAEWDLTTTDGAPGFSLGTVARSGDSWGVRPRGSRPGS